jgi:hypothetical protein
MRKWPGTVWSVRTLHAKRESLPQGAKPFFPFPAEGYHKNLNSMTPLVLTDLAGEVAGRCPRYGRTSPLTITHSTPMGALDAWGDPPPKFLSLSERRNRSVEWALEGGVSFPGSPRECAVCVRLDEPVCACSRSVSP